MPLVNEPLCWRCIKKNKTTGCMQTHKRDKYYINVDQTYCVERKSILKMLQLTVIVQLVQKQCCLIDGIHSGRTDRDKRHKIHVHFLKKKKWCSSLDLDGRWARGSIQVPPVECNGQFQAQHRKQQPAFEKKEKNLLWENWHIQHRH